MDKRNSAKETAPRSVPLSRFPEIKAPEANVRDWKIPAPLVKFEDYLVDPFVRTVRVGVGWDRGADIDGSVALFDQERRPLDTVWYRQLVSRCGSIVHSGDNLTGVGSGDDEVIKVNLDGIPHHIHHLLFTVSVFSHNVSFSQVQSAYVRMIHGKEKYKDCEMCRFSLTEMSGHAMLLGVLTRKGAYWNFRSLGIPATGRTIEELLQNPRNLDCISEIPSFHPELRYVTVTVLAGRGLAAKDRTGFFRTLGSSDPYHVIKFKNKRYTSEMKPKTLDPDWNSPPFDIGAVTESDPKRLKIRVFDYDQFSSDDFMGEVVIPGHALFNLGAGQRMYWFPLSTSDKKEYRNEAVSGEVLIEFNVR